MELVKNSPMEVGWLTWRFEPSAGERLVVVVKATFDLVPEGPCPLSSKQALVTGDEPWDGDVEASNRYDSDLALLKPCGEWWLTGTLQREEPARELACRARVGGLETRFSVIGDRWWEPAGGMSAPAPFTTMPLRWERCFGGPGWRENPLGAGLALDRADPSGRVRLPNIEQADRLIRSPRERPASAAAWPIPRAWPKRMKLLGSYGGDYLSERWPYFAEDMSWAHFLAAPEAQRLGRGYWRGDEEIELAELHPAHPWVRCRLPGLRPRAFLFEPARPQQLTEVGLVLDTVAIDVGEGQAFAVWRGSAPCRDESLSEYAQLFVTQEGLTHAQRPEHYFAAFVGEMRARSEEQRGFEPEAPPSAPAVQEESLEASEAEAPAEEVASVEAILEGRRAAARAEGWPEAVIAALYPPARAAETGSPAALRAQIEEAIALSAQLGLPDATREGLRHALEALDDEEAEPPPEPKRPKPPPQLWNPQERREEVLRRIEAGESLVGVDLADADLSLLDLSGVDLSGVILIRADLRHATFDGARLDGATLDEALLEGATFRAASLVGATLSLAEADGVDFSGALLDGASGERTKLSAAIFRGAKCRRVYFEGCAAAGADFEEAQLDEADFPDSDLSDANFRGASLADARFDGANLRRARMDGVQAPKLRASGGADLSDASLQGAQLREAAFAGSVLVRTRMTECDLTRAIFSQARLEGAELLAVLARGAMFSGAILTGASLHGADLLGARFDGAVLRDADLRNANAFQAEFWRADLTGARFDGANLEGTKLE